jgi:hypothetical protein
MADDSDRLTSAPRQAMTCQNCARPMFPPRCACCGWTDPDADAGTGESKPVGVSDDTGEFVPLIVPPPDAK